MRVRCYRIVTLLLFTFATTVTFALPPTQVPDTSGGNTGSGGAAKCIYWHCVNFDNGQAKCSEALSYKTGDYAQQCSVMCDGPGCWCTYKYTCYLI